jgi:hypothetical protein
VTYVTARGAVPGQDDRLATCRDGSRCRGDTALAHSPVDMPAGHIDEIEQLILSDVVPPHYQTDRGLA